MAPTMFLMLGNLQCWAWEGREGEREGRKSHLTSEMVRLWEVLVRARIINVRDISILLKYSTVCPVWWSCCDWDLALSATDWPDIILTPGCRVTWCHLQCQLISSRQYKSLCQEFLFLYKNISEKDENIIEPHHYGDTVFFIMHCSIVKIIIPGSYFQYLLL